MSYGKTTLYPVVRESRNGMQFFTVFLNPSSKVNISLLSTFGIFLYHSGIFFFAGITIFGYTSTVDSYFNNGFLNLIILYHLACFLSIHSD